MGVFASIVQAAPLPADPSRQEAQDFERLGQWEQACEAYARLLAQDRQQPEVRDRLRQCVRRLHQDRRHRDPVYRSTILSLPPSAALSLYVDVLTKLHGQYADTDRVPFDRLFQNGLEELRAALTDPTFLHEHLLGIEPNALAELRDQLRQDRPIATLKEALATVRELAWETERLTGLSATVTILEFACGACNALDEFTFFLTPGQPLDDPTALSGELAAYGLLLNWKDRQLVVERIVPGSYAATLELQAGDRVTHIGKHALEKLTPAAIVELLRGEPTAIAELTIAGGEMSSPRVLTLPGFVPSVLDDRIERDGIGYLRVANFQTTTLRELDSSTCPAQVRGDASARLRFAGQSRRLVRGCGSCRRTVPAGGSNSFDTWPVACGH